MRSWVNSGEFNAFPDYRRIDLRTCIGHGRIRPSHSAISPRGPNHSAICPVACDGRGSGRYAAGTPELVSKRRQNALPAMPEQCCTCRRAPCLSWLSHSVPRAFLTRGGKRVTANFAAITAAIFFAAASRRSRTRQHEFRRWLCWIVTLRGHCQRPVRV